VRPEAQPVVEKPFLGIVIEKPASEPEKLIEVELRRKYAPDGQNTEIKTTVPAGTVISLPKAEAVRALKLGIALATDRTFG
jgi:hypothetical protein